MNRNRLSDWLLAVVAWLIMGMILAIGLVIGLGMIQRLVSMF